MSFAMVEGAKPRAVVFCRCSTEEESQKDALIQQQREAKDCVVRKGWRLVDLYVEAKSGTTTKGRQEYNRLFGDLDTDKFDIVVIKSQDRLMRNVKDWYLFLDKLQVNQKQLYMYLEQRFYAPEDALLTGIKAILAEEYSRELSKKINLAHRQRQQEGKMLTITNATYGYCKLPDKSVVVDEKERGLIERIFQYTIAGYGSTKIAKCLYEEGYRNRREDMISPSVIRDIIANPLYMGTAVQNQTHRDFERKQTVSNPQEEWIYHQGAVPPIISKEDFDRANALLLHRRQKYAPKAVQSKGREKMYKQGGRSGFSGMLICGICKKPYYRTIRTVQNMRNHNNYNGNKLVEWKCSTYVLQGRGKEAVRELYQRKEKTQPGCDNVNIKEQTLYELVGKAMQIAISQKHQDTLTHSTCDLLNKLFTEQRAHGNIQLESECAKWTSRKQILMDKLLDGVVSNQEYIEKLAEIEEQMIRLTKQRGINSNDNQGNEEESRKRLSQIANALEHHIVNQAYLKVRLSEVTKVIVYPDRLVIYQKTGSKPTVIAHHCSTSSRAFIEREKRDIVTELLDNPQSALADMAARRHKSIATIRRRIQELEEAGILSYDRRGKSFQILKTEVR